MSSLLDYTNQIRDTYQSKLDVKQNHIMTVLTVVTTVFMPLTLIVGWYGMDKGGFNLGLEAHMNNAHLVFARACSEPNPDVHSGWSWKKLNETCWDLLKSGRINCEDIIDPVVSFEEAGDAYRTYLIEKPAESVKLGVVF